MSEMHDLVAPYALDALDPEEATLFEAHLATCPRCERELADLREGAAWLAGSVATPAPDHLRAAMLQAVADEEGDGAEVVQLTSRGRSQRLAWVAAVAAAVIAVVFFGMWSVSNRALDEAQQVAAVFEAPDAVVVEMTGTHGPARFVFSESLQRGVFNGSELVELGDDEVYELWLIDADGPRAAGTLMAGDPSVLVEAVSSGQTFAMTVEQAPGVDVSTSDPIFASEL